MALKDKILVNEEDISAQYLYSHKSMAIARYNVLNKSGLLPLTVQTLTEEPGRSLLHLATWIYLSGSLGDGPRFFPQISGSQSRLEELMEKNFNGLRDNLKIKDNGKGKIICFTSDSGAFGRLFHSMGISMLPRESPTKKTRRTKPHWATYDLPKYIWDIDDSLSDCDTTYERFKREDLLKTIGRIFFTDRFKSYSEPRGKKNANYMLLGNWSQYSSALQYIRQVIEFFKTLIPDMGFRDEQMRVTRSSYGLYLSKLYLDDSQIRSLTEYLFFEGNERVKQHVSLGLII